MVELKRQLPASETIVLKLGTQLVIENGIVAWPRLHALASVLSELPSYRFVLVTSGAMGCGKTALPKLGSNSLADKQALAAIGQSRLMHAFDDVFAKHGLLTAQVLLTRADIKDRVRYLNIKNTLVTLLNNQVIPIINENDTTATEEIQWGNNDILSALVNDLVESRLLIMMTSISGLMDFESGFCINESCGVSQSMYSLVTKQKTLMGSGGMQTKLDAAKMVTENGEHAIICDGREPKILHKILAGEVYGTWFKPKSKKPLKQKKRWIIYGTQERGRLYIDEGAYKALIERGSSLLASGIKSIDGDFDWGDWVSIYYEDCLVAKGQISCKSQHLIPMLGKKTNEILSHMGKNAFVEVVHRDHLALI